jgi:hypothetical protein
MDQFICLENQNLKDLPSNTAMQSRYFLHTRTEYGWNLICNKMSRLKVYLVSCTETFLQHDRNKWARRKGSRSHPVEFGRGRRPQIHPRWLSKADRVRNIIESAKPYIEVLRTKLPPSQNHVTGTENEVDTELVEPPRLEILQRTVPFESKVCCVGGNQRNTGRRSFSTKVYRPSFNMFLIPYTVEPACGYNLGAR